MRHQKSLVNYLKKEDIEVKDIKLLTTNPTAFTNANKLTVKREDEEKVMSGDIWPRKIFVRYFKASRQQGDGGGQFQTPMATPTRPAVKAGGDAAAGGSVVAGGGVAAGGDVAADGGAVAAAPAAAGGGISGNGG